MKTRTIRQQVTLKAGPHAVYETLMDSHKHTELTGDEAHISRKVGEKFTAGSGYIDGVNLKLVPDKLIVQSWRGSEWPEGHYSEATFSLEEKEGGTLLTFTQTGVPEEHYQEINQGWQDYYWEPLKELPAK